MGRIDIFPNFDVLHHEKLALTMYFSLHYMIEGIIIDDKKVVINQPVALFLSFGVSSGVHFVQ